MKNTSDPILLRKSRTLNEVKGTARSAAYSLWRTHREKRRSRSPVNFLTDHFWPWVVHYLAVMFTPRPPFPVYRRPLSESPGLFPLPEDSVVAMAGDWGTGTDRAFKVADQIRTLSPDFTIHLGDVYYSGTYEEYRDYFLGEGDWPSGSRGTYLLNGNHEMYSGGKGYFYEALPKLKQETSYFCLENRYWRIVAVDTGYYSRTVPLLELLLSWLIRLHSENLKWLKEVVFKDPADRRPVILLSHHQGFSAFDTEYTRVVTNLAPFLDRVLLWFWGHEHRFAAYAPRSVNGSPPIRARCIGHGGMPIELGEKPSRSDRGLVCLDDRKATELDGKPIGFCGYSLLRFAGPELVIEYVDENGLKLLEEKWSQAGGKLVGEAHAAPELKVLPGQSINAITQT